MDKEIVQTIISKTTAIVSGVVLKDIASELQGILDDNVPDEDKLNSIYELTKELEGGKLNGN